MTHKCPYWNKCVENLILLALSRDFGPYTELKGFCRTYVWHPSSQSLKFMIYLIRSVEKSQNWGMCTPVPVIIWGSRLFKSPTKCKFLTAKGCPFANKINLRLYGVCMGPVKNPLCHK